MILVRASWLLLLIVLASCATYQASEICTIDTTTGLPVIHADKLGHSIITSQKVLITNGSHSFEFYAQLEIANNQLVLVAMSSLGNKLFQLSGNRATAGINTWGVPLDFDASYLLADLGLIYAKADIIRQCLADTRMPIRFAVPDTHTRIFKGNDVDIRIEYAGNGEWPDEIHYRNNIMRYEIRVQTLSVDFL